MGVDEIAERYRHFAREAHGRSPLYEQLAARVAEDSQLLALISSLSRDKRQPNLLFAAVQYLVGIGRTPRTFAGFKAFVVDRFDELSAGVARRRTQTNEPGRCATLLPAFALVDQPLALLEVGAAAGLCLLADRYAYDYGDGMVRGDASSPVRLACELRGSVPRLLPEGVDVAWRAGIDLDPVDVGDPDAVRWIEACVWPDQPNRLTRLRAAVRVARRQPPRVVTGDLVDALAAVASSAPQPLPLCVYHSAVLGYLPTHRREKFIAVLGEIAAHRPLVWVSNEAPAVIPGLAATHEQTSRGETFLLTASIFRGQQRRDLPLAVTDPHGAFLDWRATSRGLV
ncbi:DUF2332 domain-containing protein [soil metagenome]